jgi:hypothetical protein
MNEVDTTKQRAHVHIHPTVGRMVHFHLGNPNQGPYPGWGVTPDGSNTYAAIVAYVHNANMVNLAVYDANGIQMGFTSVPLVQDADERVALLQGEKHIGHWCEWMPYQIGQAAHTEQLERQIANEARAAVAPTLNTPYAPDDPAAKRESKPAADRISSAFNAGHAAADAYQQAGTTAAMTWDKPSPEGVTHPVHAATQALDNDGNATAAAEASMVPHAFEGGSVTGDGSGEPLPAVTGNGDQVVTGNEDAGASPLL